MLSSEERKVVVSYRIQKAYSVLGEAKDVAKLTVRQIMHLMDDVMHRIRQDAIDGKTSTIYYLYPEYSEKDYSPLISKLEEDGYKVKFKTIYDQRDGDYCQLTISWKSHVMNEKLSKVQKKVKAE